MTTFIVSAIFFFLINISVSLRHGHNNLTDMESLLAFKSGVSDPYNFLATNWTANASSFCNDWYGVTCNKRQRVVMLEIPNLSLHGTISPHLGNLSFLSYLNLGVNNLTGTIPSSIGKLPRITFLRLHDNNLVGSIPHSIFNTSFLSTLSLTYNNLSGPLPDDNDLSMSPLLEYIFLSDNFLSGKIPSSLEKCKNLLSLSLTFNEFSGEIPAELGNITGLQVLFLGVNKLTGTIPASIGNITMLRNFSIAENNIDGLIPETLGNLLKLESIQLSDNLLTGPIPASLWNASNLDFIELVQNNLNGSIPTTIGFSLPKLSVFSVHHNQLTGDLDFITSLSNSKNLAEIQIGYNQLQGSIPDSIGNLSTGLEVLFFTSNYFQGRIPAGIGNLTSLVNLILDKNELSGEIPPTLSRLKRIQGMFITRNNLSGKIPDELCVITSLNYLDLSYNTLHGSIPYSLGNMSALSYLNLASNKLSSSIPDSLWRLSGLLELYLSENMLEGLLSQEIKNLKILDRFDLSKNNLLGYIPSSLGELQMVTHFNVSSNSFNGPIPLSVKGLISIEYLNLSYNFLSGTIPESLAKLSHLRGLDLSFNKLEGEIPQAFSNLSMVYLEGNTALCGVSQLGFPSCSSVKSRNKLYLLKYIIPPIVVIILASCFLVVWLLRKKLEPETMKVSKPVLYDHLVRATDNFSDANLLGRGSFASVFKAYMDDGSITAVKVLNVEDQTALRSFDVESKILCMVRHRNLVKIIDTCSYLNLKALVLEFMPNGSLEDWLYSDSKFLNLSQRLNIIMDVALALEYLHHEHHQIIVHRDLKPSNVLLDEDMTAHVSDFGISKLLLHDSKSILSTNTLGTFGYIAPECGSSGNVSRESDVYSFGILVLEMLTRKKPSDAMFDEEMNLRQWVSESYPNGVLDLLDPNILKENYQACKQQQIPLADNIDECLSSLVNLGLRCSSNLPKERIAMTDVVPILQKIRTGYLSS